MIIAATFIFFIVIIELSQDNVDEPVQEGTYIDANDWSINTKQFYEIAQRVNGTWGDETILDGKTKTDILPERQKLYNYLKENNLLLQQFI